MQVLVHHHPHHPFAAFALFLVHVGPEKRTRSLILLFCFSEGEQVSTVSLFHSSSLPVSKHFSLCQHKGKEVSYDE
jgi:hypothetical protein